MGKNVLDRWEATVHIAIGQERPQTRSFQMTEAKVWLEWKLQGGGEEKVAGETWGPDPDKSRNPC